MTEPPSRQYEAYKANGWPNQVAEYDPHGVAAGGMYADCDGCRSRDWFGPNPWSEPGSAKHLDFVMGGSGGNILGVCGASPSHSVQIHVVEISFLTRLICAQVARQRLQHRSAGPLGRGSADDLQGRRRDRRFLVRIGGPRRNTSIPFMQ